MNYAGITEDIDEWIGKRIMLAVLFFIIGFLIPLSLGEYFSLNQTIIKILFSFILGILFFALTAFIYYFHLEHQIDDRVKRVETVLPDFLLLVASNLRSGMTPFNAFKNSSREEFGPLSEEIKTISTKSLGIESFRNSLKQLSEKIDSRILKESVAFFSESMRAGGKLAKLLEASSEDISKTQEMKKEMISGTKMYVLFVLFVIIVATPLLMSISVQFLEMINSIQGQSAVDESLNIGFLSAKIAITSNFMHNIAVILLLGNSILASLFIGVLTERKIKLGLKYSPIIFIASFILFTAFKTVISGFLSIV